MSLLTIDDLTIEFRRDGRVTRPVRGVSLHVEPAEIVGVVGETGCGKTLTGLSVLGLLPHGASVSGSIRLHDQELLAAPLTRISKIRGGSVAMVFQNPGTAFDPVRTIGAQFQLVIRTHRRCSGAEARTLAERLLGEVELGARVLTSYPHQLSGACSGAMIALALSCEPQLVIADEATSALDVTVAQQVRRLLLRLQGEHGFGVLFVTHNLAEAYDLCDRMYVLYAGQVVESGPTAAVFEQPAHPYTRALLGALPRPDRVGAALIALGGSVPTDVTPMRGCAFAERCSEAGELCRNTPPGTTVLAEQRSVACHLLASSGGLA
jgi:peptide/nickel transport system ATP-binding protein